MDVIRVTTMSMPIDAVQLLFFYISTIVFRVFAVLSASVIVDIASQGAPFNRLILSSLNCAPDKRHRERNCRDIA